MHKLYLVTKLKLMINNYNNSQSSCYFLDLRNSTFLVRTISLSTNNGSSNPKKSSDANKLLVHSEFMMNIHETLFFKLKELGINEFYFNNTGDGHVCLLWDKTHAWSALSIACTLTLYLEKRIKKYQDDYLTSWSNEFQKDLRLGFGVGIHSGGSIIIPSNDGAREFAFGIVLNSAARIESFTKTFPSLTILFTQNFKSQLKRQHKYFKTKHNWNWYENIFDKVTEFPVDTKDSRTAGHILYTISSKNRKYFASL